MDGNDRSITNFTAVPSQPCSCILSPREGDGHVNASRTGDNITAALSELLFSNIHNHKRQL